MVCSVAWPGLTCWPAPGLVPLLSRSCGGVAPIVEMPCATTTGILMTAPPPSHQTTGGPTFFTTTNQDELKPFTAPKRVRRLKTMRTTRYLSLVDGANDERIRHLSFLFSFFFFLRFTQEPPARPPRGGAGDAIQGTGPVAKFSLYRDEYQPLAVSKVCKNRWKDPELFTFHRPSSTDFHLTPAAARHTARA